MSELLDAYWRVPPFTRTLVTAIVVTSFGSYFGLLPFGWFYFDARLLLKFLPEIWRPFTSFFITGPKVGLIMDPWMVYQYMTQLELAHTRFPRKEDVLWYLLAVGTIIITLNSYFTGSMYFLQGLITALCYTAVQDRRGEKTTFFFFSVPAQTVPYCILFSSLLMDPTQMPLQITGILAAHLFDFLTRIYPEFSGGPNLLPTPAFLSWIVQTPRILNRSHGTAIRPQTGADTATGKSTGTSGPVLPESWRSRGAGHRLGGE